MVDEQLVVILEVRAEGHAQKARPELALELNRRTIAILGIEKLKLGSGQGVRRAAGTQSSTISRGVGAIASTVARAPSSQTLRASTSAVTGVSSMEETSWSPSSVRW